MPQKIMESRKLAKICNHRNHKKSLKSTELAIIVPIGVDVALRAPLHACRGGRSMAMKFSNPNRFHDSLGVIEMGGVGDLNVAW